MVTILKKRSVPGIEVVPCRVNGPRGIVKSFILFDDDNTVLVDSGYSEEDGRLIVDALHGIDRGVEDVSAAVLTHRHNDHIGGILELLSESMFPVFAHADEAEAIQEKIGLSADRLLSDGDSLSDILEGLRVIHMPGHTSGHVGLYWESKSTFVAGDSIFSAAEALVVSPPFASMDPEMARESVRRLLEMGLDIETVLVAHGEDVHEGAEDALSRILQERRLHP